MKAALTFSLTLAVLVILPVSAETAPDPFSLTISALHDTVKVSSDLHVDIALKNISDHERAVAFAHGAPEATFEIRAFDNSTGKAAARTPSHRAIRRDDGSFDWGGGSTIISTFKPGKEVHQDVLLNKLFDLSRPGKYTLDVRFTDVLESKTTIKSNSITVTVTP